MSESKTTNEPKAAPAPNGPAPLLPVRHVNFSQYERIPAVGGLTRKRDPNTGRIK
jgi:hypothetical protein